MRHNLLLSFCLLTSISTFAQVFSNKEVGKKNEELAGNWQTV